MPDGISFAGDAAVACVQTVVSDQDERFEVLLVREVYIFSRLWREKYKLVGGNPDDVAYCWSSVSDPGFELLGAVKFCSPILPTIFLEGLVNDPWIPPRNAVIIEVPYVNLDNSWRDIVPCFEV